jgi:hypothetical protein
MNTQQQALRRSKNNRWIAGVCGGLGIFLGLPPFGFASPCLLLSYQVRARHFDLYHCNDYDS